MTMMIRQFFTATALLMPVMAVAQTDNAANYPTQPVRFVVPFSAGGGTDVIMRLIAKNMTDAWKVNVIVDNRVGAGGVVGSQHVTQQKPDGRTFLAVASAFAVRAAIDRGLPYDVNKDFTGVGQMARSPSFMVVSPSHGFGSLKELIAYAKKQPAGILYGSAGVGSTAHLQQTGRHACITGDHLGARATIGQLFTFGQQQREGHVQRAAEGGLHLGPAQAQRVYAWGSQAQQQCQSGGEGAEQRRAQGRDGHRLRASTGGLSNEGYRREAL